MEWLLRALTGHVEVSKHDDGFIVRDEIRVLAVHSAMYVKN